MTMPNVDRAILDAAELNDDERAIIALVVKKNGQVRATKPKVSEDNPITGKAAYVWRMVAFVVSRNSKHHCMPICADFDLPAFNDDGKWSSKLARVMSKELKPVEDAILNSIPKTQWYGVNRWVKAIYGS